jgi:hypothetical protein
MCIPTNEFLISRAYSVMAKFMIAVKEFNTLVILEPAKPLATIHSRNFKASVREYS